MGGLRAPLTLGQGADTPIWLVTLPVAAQPPDLIEFKPENQTPAPFQGCKCPINRYNIYYQYIIL